MNDYIQLNATSFSARHNIERWEAAQDLPPDADNDAIIEAYRPEIDRLVKERGYQTFDMGPNPSFTAIRLFNNPEGWVANFTGDGIAGRFPQLDN